MDDDELVREVAAQMIASLGHAVATAANGEEAIELFRAAREEGRPFDVVILDLTVKNGMGGEEAIRRLRELDPDVKAVVSSGYSDAAVVADYRRARLLRLLEQAVPAGRPAGLPPLAAETGRRAGLIAGA